MSLAAFTLLAVAAAAPAPATAPAAEPQASVRPEEARIPFANSTGIRAWRAEREEGEDVLYIEGVRRQWYRAELFGYCPDIRFANAIAFDSGPTGTFDRFSRVIVRHDVCRIRSLVKIEGEPPSSRKARKAKDESEA